MRRLAEMPEMGHLREDLAEEPLRFWPVYSYLIIYRPDRNPLEVVRVLSGYRDIADLLS
jgi:antitoxin ParD1/3/4/toxin ParE1/3/4